MEGTAAGGHSLSEDVMRPHYPFVFVFLWLFVSLVVVSCKHWNCLFFFNSGYFSPHIYWGTIDKKYIYLRCATCWFDINIPCEMITVKLISSQSDLFFHKTRMVAIYPLSKFQLYSKVLSTRVTMRCVRSLGLIHLVTERLDPSNNLSPFPQPPGLTTWQPPFYNFFFLWVWFFFFFFFNSTCKWYHALFVFIFLA